MYHVNNVYKYQSIFYVTQYFGKLFFKTTEQITTNEHKVRKQKGLNKRPC